MLTNFVLFNSKKKLFRWIKMLLNFACFHCFFALSFLICIEWKMNDSSIWIYWNYSLFKKSAQLDKLRVNCPKKKQTKRKSWFSILFFLCGKENIMRREKWGRPLFSHTHSTRHFGSVEYRRPKAKSKRKSMIISSKSVHMKKRLSTNARGPFLSSSSCSIEMALHTRYNHRR